MSVDNNYQNFALRTNTVFNETRGWSAFQPIA
jgi:hypothetical protein